MDLEQKIKDNEQLWKNRGYSLGEYNGEPAIDGDSGQFYCDAVANDAEAVYLMEYLRQNGELEYERFVAEAADDGIDLDRSQDVFLGKSGAGLNF